MSQSPQSKLPTYRDWAREFRRAARAADRGVEYQARCLKYARRLLRRGFVPIMDVRHLCLLVGYSPDYVLGVCQNPGRYYRRFEVPKARGGARLISEPLPSLKVIQRWLLGNIFCALRVSPYAKAYVQGRSIKDAARFHLRQKVVLKLDVADFFPSLAVSRLYGLLRAVGYRKRVASVIAKICTLNGGLPQGAPSSPAISNALMAKFDARVAGWCRQRHYRYTRYADDLLFSGDINAGSVVNFVRRCLLAEGLVLNEKKISAMHQGRRQRALGVVLNERMQIPRRTRRRLRQEVHYIQRFGLQSHAARSGEEDAESYLRGLRGRVAFASFVNRDDEGLRTAKQFLQSLNA